jgi:hypothetical protein
MVPSSLQPFSVDAEFAGFVLFEHVEGDTCEDGMVLCRVAGAFSAKVLAESDVQYPSAVCFRCPSAGG